MYNCMDNSNVKALYKLGLAICSDVPTDKYYVFSKFIILEIV